MGKLDNRVAIVTGGGRGIGRGISLVLAREGASIVLADIDRVNAPQTAQEIRDLGRQAIVVHTDVTNPDSAEAAVQEAVSHFGRVDILVNNAGVVGQHVGGGNITLDDWDACYQVNLKGIWIMSRAMVPHFKEKGGGKIVNIASIAGRKGGPGLAHYCASKAGAISVTQSLARDLGPGNINVNAVCPGLLWTDMWRQLEAMIGGDETPEVVDRRQVFDAFLSTNCPLRREQTPEDIGMAVAFLASEEAKNITGQALNVDGGIELN
ncbi:MAG: glucose 1-dehydrogenase [Chloroflexi bacterium]|nr:glucose 1-dehydrogenase [Chloroflexota bacterium]